MIYLDKLGAKLVVGDFVCSHYNRFKQELGIFKVTGFTKKMIQLQNLETKNKKVHLRYANRTLKLTVKQVKPLLFVVLKNI